MKKGKMIRDDMIYEGSFIDNLLDGETTVYNKNKFEKYTVTYKYGELNKENVKILYFTNY